MANLCTRSDYKAYKKIEHAKDDSQIDVLITSISELVKTYCGSTLIDYYGSDKQKFLIYLMLVLQRFFLPSLH